jgi:hypothetical protein
MAHYTLLENNIVYQVIVGSDENYLINGYSPEKAYASLYNCKVLRTSYNTRGGIHYQEDNTPSEDQTKAFRKNYAGIGYYYDEQRDAFIPPKPYSSWVLNEFSCLWESPVPYPNDGYIYMWNEESQTWNIINNI